ncbi:Transposase [Neochlamydia sp. EPS4]|nr:Transposase [Neochlamydia sp. EPS4]
MANFRIFTEYETILINATETLLERPNKNKSAIIQGNRKHTPYRTNLQPIRKVICTLYCNGKKHDFRLFTEYQVKTHPTIKVLTNSVIKD